MTPWLSGDGLQLLLAVVRVSTERRFRCDRPVGCAAERRGAKPWGEPENHGADDQLKFDERGPAVSPTGTLDWFQSNRPGGQGGRRSLDGERPVACGTVRFPRSIWDSGSHLGQRRISAVLSNVGMVVVRPQRGTDMTFRSALGVVGENFAAMNDHKLQAPWLARTA